ncbi:DJ-1/PfpI family protein [Bdellovibrio sp. HCB337]|uniref:DJ-1/PfpI family protein n=1 Tax=Bdellovibrio sp. HCB337 TaxID=3394358 RepID=UPI0039A69EE3
MDNTSRPSIVTVLYPGCIFFELALATELLAEKYQIIFVTPDGADHQASNGSVIRAHASYKEVDLANCKAVLVPGGDPGSIQDNTDIDQLIRTAHSKGLWLAAICAGPFVFAKAQVLKGKRIAHGYNQEHLEFLKSYFEDVELTNEQFVCDGHVITAKPDAHIDFAVELACRLQAADATLANRTKDYYRGTLGRKIRPLALALIQNEKGQFLFHRGHDRVKGEYFYRPLGGGIEFAESGIVAIEREIAEELNLAIHVSGLKASFENIFAFEGKTGHEVILMFAAAFKDTSVYEKQELDILESGTVIAKAVWKSVAEIKAEGAKLYPIGLEEVINGR